MPRHAQAMPILPIILVAGVSGAGKSVIGAALAQRLGCPFQEGDDLHPAANVAKMRAGLPLDDADRAPWLDRVAGWIIAAERAGLGGVISCSALKRAYRDRLREAAGPGLRIVLLAPPLLALRERVAARRHGFMPAALLDSQLATLEMPVGHEDVVVIGGMPDIAAACDRILGSLSLG